MPMTRKDHQAAQRHLRRVDPVMREIIRRVGPVKLRLERNRFAMLVRSIISQQISTSAARSIRLRLESLLAPDKITPARIAGLSLDQLRGVGLSGQKASYMLDLSEKVGTGDVDLQQIGRLRDDSVIERLTCVRGIGHWTAQMFLMFSLGRPDVFPFGDLGVRAAIRNSYGLADLPDRKTSESIADAWHPHATIASWYLWRSLETNG